AEDIGEPRRSMLALAPQSRLFDGAADDEREYGRHGADEKKHAPSERLEHERGEAGREKRTDRPTRLHDADRFRAMMRRPHLGDQNRTARPLSAHADAD